MCLQSVFARPDIIVKSIFGLSRKTYKGKRCKADAKDVKGDKRVE